MGRKRTLVALGGLGLACGLFCAPAMGANVVYTGASADGARVFFETAEKMTPDDGDISVDVFERSGATTTRVSVGQIGGNTFDSRFAGASADGTRVFFTTLDKLVSADTDNAIDIYERSGGTTSLISTGPSGGNANTTAFFRGVSADGTKVFFETLDKLVPEDTDPGIQGAGSDVYQRSAGTTTLISIGPVGGSGNNPAHYAGISSTGTRVFFETSEKLVATDTDTIDDVYQRVGTTTTLISAGQINGNNSLFGASFTAASDGGTRVFFETNERLVSADTDGAADIYMRVGSTTTRESAGQVNGNGAFAAGTAAVSSVGTTLYFTTDERLVSADGDSGTDVYKRTVGSSGVTSLVSGGTTSQDVTFNGLATDGTVIFSTAEALASIDVDTALDVYRSTATGPNILSSYSLSSGPDPGNGPSPAQFAGMAADGSQVFFETLEPIRPQAGESDFDESRDVYRATPSASGIATLTHISRDATSGQGGFPARFAGSAADGTPAFYTSFEPLAAQDVDSFRDVFEATTTFGALLVSREVLPPQTTISGGVPNGGSTTDRTPVFGLVSSEAGSTFSCQVDSGLPIACSNPFVSDPLGEGTHTLTVRATDVAGNTDATPATRTFTVDTIPPDASIDSGPTGTTADPTPTFTFSADEPVTFACRFDSAVYAACSGTGTHTPASPLPDGPHTFRVRARDAAGNTTFAGVSFTVDVP